jgi:hypothetical protein
MKLVNTIGAVRSLRTLEERDGKSDSNIAGPRGGGAFAVRVL